MEEFVQSCYVMNEELGMFVVIIIILYYNNNNVIMFVIDCRPNEDVTNDELQDVY